MYSPPRLNLRCATRLGHCTPELAALVRNTMCDTSEDSQVRRRQLLLAAEQGDAGAQCRLGIMHHQGAGGPVDFAEAEAAVWARCSARRCHCAV